METLHPGSTPALFTRQGDRGHAFRCGAETLEHDSPFYLMVPGPREETYPAEPLRLLLQSETSRRDRLFRLREESGDTGNIQRTLSACVCSWFPNSDPRKARCCPARPEHRAPPSPGAGPEQQRLKEQYPGLSLGQGCLQEGKAAEEGRKCPGSQAGPRACPRRPLLAMRRVAGTGRRAGPQQRLRAAPAPEERSALPGHALGSHRGQAEEQCMP